nr:uncharacterized protein LOC117685065 [Crassostrea gigas]
MKQTWLSSPEGASDKAVDGKIGSMATCLFYFVSSKDVLNGTGAFSGFSVYISNTVNRHDGSLCYRDGHLHYKTTLPDHVLIDCPYYGQYVIFYNERLPGVTYHSSYSPFVYAALCEVEVYGCPSPVAYNEYCWMPCPENCEECYPGTGFCVKCKPGYSGDGCTISCHASIKRYSYSAKETLSGPIYDVKSLKGLTVTGDGLVTLDLEVFQSSTDIDYVSFSVTQTDHVMVDFFKDAYVPIQQYSRKIEQLDHWDVKVVNSLSTRVNIVRITINATTSYTLSKLVIRLRKCTEFPKYSW